MSVLTLEGFVENGRIRLYGHPRLPERARVYVVVPDTPVAVHHITSPYLADPEEAPAFAMQVTELAEGDGDAEL